MSFLRDEVFTSQQMKEEMEQALHLGARGWAAVVRLAAMREGQAREGLCAGGRWRYLGKGVRSTHIRAEAETVGAVTRRES